MWLAKLILGAAAAYVGVVVLAYTLQTRMLFPARIAADIDPPLPDSAVRLEIATADGERLHGVRIPPIEKADPRLPTLLGFGGNAWNASVVASYLHGLYPNAEVIAFHYRGYKPSTGHPSAAALLSDAVLIHDHIRDSIGAERVIGVGFSIGSGVATRMASQRPVAGLILVSPFDSLKALAADHFPWLPVKWLFRHNMEPADDLRGVAIPTAVIAAERDTIVPPARTRAFREAISAPVLDRTIAGAGHNDVYDHPEFRAAMVAALERIEAAPDPTRRGNGNRPLTSH